jgi:CRISPR/Cas system-associated protein endoribonuclease Cas2
MKRLKLTMKLYPVKERQSGMHWSESQMQRLLTVRIMNGTFKPDEKTANEAFKTLLRMGYGALDYNTYGKIVDVENMNKEQRELSVLFDLTLTM